ncbi:MAG: ArsR family transcriptional regulator [Thermoplasmata archaeon]|nr:ArsR family transcriptional regulator [Thermoplasmata archaeon]
MPKLGDALKKAVEVKPQEEEDVSRVRPSSALMNANRRKIFQYLLERPCTSTGQIAKALELSRSTISWHLDYLVKAGYVDSHVDSKKKIFCPSGLISKKCIVVFSLLNQPAILSIYRTIVREPGQDHGMLREKVEYSHSHISEILKKMLAVGLISSIRDGRHVRYFPTDGYFQIVNEDISSQKEFLRKLIIKMNAEHLRPEVNELKGGGINILFKVPGQIARIEIPYHPLKTLILTE